MAFAELQRVLAPGETIIVTTIAGRTRERVISVSDSTLEARTQSVFRSRRSGPLRTIAAPVVLRVQRVDSINNGALIGLATGAGVGIALCSGPGADCAGFLYVPVVFDCPAAVVIMPCEHHS
jgi:hypothetical protein